MAWSKTASVHPPPETTRDELTGSKRDRRRKRIAAVHGLQMSLLLGLFVGWVCAEVSQAGVSAAGDQCAEVGNALGPTLQRKIRKSHGTGGAPNGQDSALSMKVCDPALVAMLPTLGAQFGDTEEFRDMAKLFKGGGTTRALCPSSSP
jgi:hypothetical protein